MGLFLLSYVMHWMKYLDRKSPGNFQPVTSPPDRSHSGRLSRSGSDPCWSHFCSGPLWSHSCIPFPCFSTLYHRSGYSWSTETRQTRLKTRMKKFAISNISTWARWICQALLQLKSVTGRASLASMARCCASTTTASTYQCHYHRNTYWTSWLFGCGYASTWCNW